MTKRLKPSEYAEAISLWELGEVTVEDLEKKFGMRASSWASYFSRNKVKKGSRAKELAEKTKAAVNAAVNLDAELRAKRAFDTKNETYRVTEMLRKLVAATIVEARTKGHPIGSVQNDLKAIKEAAAAIKICREEAFAVLGITIDGEKDKEDIPELTIKQLTPEQITQLQKAPGAPDLDELDMEVRPSGEGDVVEGED